MNKVFIGLGSNLGNKKQNLREGINSLKSFAQIIKTSSFYETKAEGMSAGHDFDFINGVVEVGTNLSPEDLLIELKQIENKLGKKEARDSSGFKARKLDLDILIYNDLVVKNSHIQIPHPGIASRIFVLKPLVEIAPELIIPGTDLSVSEHFKNFEKNSSLTNVE